MLGRVPHASLDCPELRRIAARLMRAQGVHHGVIAAEDELAEVVERLRKARQQAASLIEGGR